MICAGGLRAREEVEQVATPADDTAMAEQLVNVLVTPLNVSVKATEPLSAVLPLGFGVTVAVNVT
jgi:hypothetical protein